MPAKWNVCEPIDRQGTELAEEKDRDLVCYNGKTVRAGLAKSIWIQLVLLCAPDAGPRTPEFLIYNVHYYLDIFLIFSCSLLVLSFRNGNVYSLPLNNVTI